MSVATSAVGAFSISLLVLESHDLDTHRPSRLVFQKAHHPAVFVFQLNFESEMSLAEPLCARVEHPFRRAMDEDDIDDDDQPRVVYADAERAGRMARYATGVGDAEDVSASRGSHGASEGGVFAPRGGAPGAAPWAFDDGMDGAPPPTLLEDDDDHTRSPARVDGRTTPGALRSGGVRDARRSEGTRPDESISDEDVDASPAAARTTNTSPHAAPQRGNRRRTPIRATTGAATPADADHAERDFLERALGNVSAAARVIASRNDHPKLNAKTKNQKPKPKPATRRSPRGKANPAAAKAVAEARATAKTTSPTGGGLASLASLGVLSRGQTKAAVPLSALEPPPRPTHKPTRTQKPSAKLAQKNRTILSKTSGGSRSLVSHPLPSTDSDEDDDGIDDASDSGGDDRNGDLNTDNGLSDVVLCTEGEELVGRAGGEKNTTPGLMSAMSRLPTKAAATDDGVFAFPKRNAVTNASQRGTTHRHGQNAPTARLQRLVHRAKARSAQFSHTAQNGEDGDGCDEDTVPEKLKQSGLGVAMELALVGDCGVEAGVCLWECVPVEQTARGDRVDHGTLNPGTAHDERFLTDTNRDESPNSPSWLRRGESSAPAPGAVVVFDAKCARELRLQPGSTLLVYHPVHEIEVAPQVGTGFKRRRVVIASLVRAG